MYLNNALKSLTYGAAMTLLSLFVMTWVPRPVILIMFAGGIFLMAYGWVITLFIFFTVVIDDGAFDPESL
jgi:uncharacterized membrane protein